jgi:hypothetical protein
MGGWQRHRITLVGLMVAGIALAAALAFFLGPRASSDPDGLERVALDHGLADQARDHDLDSSPLADYGVDSIDDDRLGTGVAGVIGVAASFALAGGLLLLVRRLRGRADRPVRGAPNRTEYSDEAQAPQRGLRAAQNGNPRERDLSADALRNRRPGERRA